MTETLAAFLIGMALGALGGWACSAIPCMRKHVGDDDGKS